MTAFLVLVTGPPGAGKTKLARQIAPRLKLPLVAKDDIKESLSDSFGKTNLRWSRRFGAATWDVMFVLVERFVSDGASAIIESNFYPDAHRDRLLDLQRRHPFAPFEVHCTAADEVLARRAATRERHPVHHRVPLGAPNDALELDANVVRVDTGTGDPVDLDELTRRIEGVRGGLRSGHHDNAGGP